MGAESIIGFWIICGIVGGVVANSRGASGAIGFLLGLFLGPLGLIICFVLVPEKTLASTSAAAFVSPPANSNGNNDRSLYKKCCNCEAFIAAEYAFCSDCGSAQND
jgi:hypothetical protein